MNKDKTLNEIHREGLAALKKQLGVAGMARFLQQFELGRGDYASERRKWVDTTTFEDIRAMAGLGRNGRKTRKAG